MESSQPKFDELFSRVYQDGEDLSYYQAKVGWVVPGTTEKTGPALAEANQHGQMLELDVFDKAAGVLGEYARRSIQVESVEYFDNGEVYRVTSAGNQHLELNEFVFAEKSHYARGNPPGEVYYLSFWVEIDPVQDVDQFDVID